MEQTNHQAVRVIGKVIHQDITLNDGAVHLSLDEETAHKCTSDLIIAHGIYALNGEGLADDVGAINGGVIDPSLDFLAQKLLAVLPENGILVHGHAGILGDEHQGVTDGLNITAIGADMIVGTNLPPDGVGGSGRSCKGIFRSGGGGGRREGGGGGGRGARERGWGGGEGESGGGEAMGREAEAGGRGGMGREAESAEREAEGREAEEARREEARREEAEGRESAGIVSGSKK